jgi:glycine/D-amino acid oxidase-like deaminating enzyme
MSESSSLRAVIVGAGLAGLACASDLAAAGAAVQVLEAGDAVGGRMRTDRRAGFLLDRGFQVFNTSYPQVRRRCDLRALQLCAFTPGVLLHTGQGRIRFTDPTRQPGRAAEVLSGRLAGPRDLAALGVLSARDMLLPARLIKRGQDRTTLAALAAAGISDELIERFFRPFLAGVFLEDELATSSRFFHLVWRSMLRGTLCLPRRGIQAVPAQLAAALPPGTIRLQAPVSSLTDDGVLLADGSELRADAVVVATGAAAAAALLPGLSVPATRTVTTVYHAAPAPPLAEPTLLVDTELVGTELVGTELVGTELVDTELVHTETVDSERKVLHTSVLSEVTRTYSGDGRALVSTSVLGEDAAGLEPAVRRRLSALYGTQTTGWEHLATYTVAGALPAMIPPHSLSRRCRVAPRRYVCGDHRATGSVQGALASGSRAAREVLTDA